MSTEARKQEWRERRLADAVARQEAQRRIQEATGGLFSFEHQHSGTEDGLLWYVVGPDGNRFDGDGWLNWQDAEATILDYFNDPAQREIAEGRRES